MALHIGPNLASQRAPFGRFFSRQQTSAGSLINCNGLIIPGRAPAGAARHSGADIGAHPRVGSVSVYAFNSNCIHPVDQRPILSDPAPGCSLTKQARIGKMAWLQSSRLRLSKTSKQQVRRRAVIPHLWERGA